MSTATCDFCDGAIVPTESTPGYAQHEGGKRACFACCAWLDIIRMREGKPIALYVDGPLVSNWTGTLIMMVLSRKDGRHNMAGKRSTYRFRGPDGSVWSGVEYHGPCSGNLLRSVRRLASKKESTRLVD